MMQDIEKIVSNTSPGINKLFSGDHSVNPQKNYYHSPENTILYYHPKKQIGKKYLLPCI